MFKNTASQKLTVIAFADAGHASLDAGEPVTGDSANITCKVEQDDDGTRTAVADTNPTETEDGQYVFDITAAECNGDKLTFYPESSTAGVQVVALPSNVIYTRPPNFPELGIESDGDLTKVNTLDGHTAQTGDSFARIGANGASLSAIPWNSSWDAEVESECNDALVSNRLDHLFAVAAATTDVVNNSYAARLVSKSATAAFSSYNNQTDSLEAIRDRGDAAWTGGSTGGGGGLTTANLPPNFNLLSITTAGVVSASGNWLTTTDLPTNFDNLSITAAGALAVNSFTTAARAMLKADLITGYRLDRLFFAPITMTTAHVADNAFAARLISKSTTAAASSYNNQTDSVEAIRDRIDATAYHQTLADEILKRSVTNVQSTMPEHSLGTIVMQQLESELTTSNTMLIKSSTGGTLFTKTLTLTTSGRDVIAIT